LTQKTEQDLLADPVFLTPKPLTLHIAADSMVEPMLGPHPSDKVLSYQYQKHLLFWAYFVYHKVKLGPFNSSPRQSIKQERLHTQNYEATWPDQKSIQTEFVCVVPYITLPKDFSMCLDMFLHLLSTPFCIHPP